MWRQRFVRYVITSFYLRSYVVNVGFVPRLSFVHLSILTIKLEDGDIGHQDSGELYPRPEARSRTFQLVLLF